jgi:hypothetical protein
MYWWCCLIKSYAANLVFWVLLAVSVADMLWVLLLVVLFVALFGGSVALQLASTRYKKR